MGASSWTLIAIDMAALCQSRLWSEVVHPLTNIKTKKKVAERKIVFTGPHPFPLQMLRQAQTHERERVWFSVCALRTRIPIRRVVDSQRDDVANCTTKV